MDDIFSKTQFVVEATCTEQLYLWAKYSKDVIWSPRTELNRYTWEQHSIGLLVTVGHLYLQDDPDPKPVNLHCRWAEINGILVMFHELVSAWTDYFMMEKWLTENCSPRWDRGYRLAHTDAGNFHHVIDYIDCPERR